MGRKPINFSYYRSTTESLEEPISPKGTETKFIISFAQELMIRRTDIPEGDGNGGILVYSSSNTIRRTDIPEGDGNRLIADDTGDSAN